MNTLLRSPLRLGRKSTRRPFRVLFSSKTTGEDADIPEELAAQTTNPALISLFKNPIVHQLWTARNEAKTLARGGDYDTTTGKPPSASRVEVSYPFSKDPLLMETYRNPFGNMRLGRVMEDLDALAGNIAFFHVHSAEKLIVTASVDRIRLRHRPQVESDQHLSGQVTWTGRSSMEIRMLCRDDHSEEWLEAFVTFVTLDPDTKKPVPVPPLIPETPEERAHFDAGAARAALRKRRRASTSEGSTPQANRLAQSLLQQAAPLLSMPSLADPNTILMSQTALQNAFVAQPQVRNLHNRIFGGYLMRVAYELAFSNAYLFAGIRPLFLEVDEVSFTKPVDVGDLLVFDSRVLYTEQGGSSSSISTETTSTSNTTTTTNSPALVHVQVQAWVTEPEQVSAVRANEFHFTFSADRAVRNVLPSNIDEAQAAATRMVEERTSSS